MTAFFDDLADDLPDMTPAEIAAGFGFLFAELLPKWGRAAQPIDKPLEVLQVQSSRCQRMARPA